MTQTINPPYIKPENPAVETLEAHTVVPQATKKARELTREDTEIVMMLETLKQEMDALHNNYNQTTDPLLVDSLSYAIKSAHMKYMYYLQLCKDKGIIRGGIAL